MMQATVVNYDDGREVLFSYKTPVAGFHPGRGWVRTASHYSVTTSKHINIYMRGVGADIFTTLPDAEFKALMGGPVAVSPLRKR